MTYKSTLAKAIAFAAEKHGEQTTLRGRPYVLHPLRVMQAMDTEEEMVVAVLHDVVEDTDATIDDLWWLSDAQIVAISVLTHKNGEPYTDYIEKVAENKLATKVKIADLQDNMRVDRLPVFDDRAERRMKKYTKAMERLTR